MQVNFQIINNLWRAKPIQNKQQSVVINPFAQNKVDTFISFRGDYCSPKNFQVKNLPNLHCPACGQIMLSEAQIKNYIKDVGSKKGEELIKALEKYEDESIITGEPSKDKSGFGVYRPFKKEVVDVYKRLAYENPKSDLLALTKSQAKICINNLIAQQMLIIEELRAYVENNFEDKDEREALMEKIKAFEKQIKGEADETFARKKFVSAIKNATNSEHAAQVDKIISKMPSSESDIDSFFVKYARAKSANEIASKFIKQTSPTTEHLKPQSLGGSDSLANYICDCEDCNNKRGTTPFYDWIQTLVGFEDRLQEYIDEVRVAIDNDKLDDDYDTYIESVVKTLEEMSEGEIILDVPEVNNPKKKALVLKRREREITQLGFEHKQIKEIARQYQAEIDALEKYEQYLQASEYFEFLRELESINSQLFEINAAIKNLKPVLADLKKEVDCAKEKINDAKTPAIKILFTKEYEKLNAQYQQKLSENNLLTRKEGKLQRRKISLKRLKKPFAVKERTLNEQLEKYRSVVSSINTLDSKIEGLGNYLQKEESLSAQLAQLGSEIAALKEANSEIIQRGVYTTGNTSNYNKYTHQKELLRTAENILQNKSFSRIDANYGMAREVVGIAIKTIKETLAELEALDEVKYFINMAEIGAKMQEKEKFEARYESVLQVKKEALALQEQIDSLCAGEDKETIKQKYVSLAEEKRTIGEISRIDDKKAKLATLQKMIQKNEAAFKKLEGFQVMSNIEYEEAINLIEISDVF